MKKIISFLICIILFGGISTTNSCKKTDKIKGCTDKDSQTYDPTAEQDNGSCLYQGAVVFWYSQIASNGLLANGATSLTFYLNGEVVGTSLTSDYWTVAPSCGDSGTITTTRDLGHEKSHAYLLSVKDQTGLEYWAASVSYDANTCTSFQLRWSSK